MLIAGALVVGLGVAAFAATAHASIAQQETLPDTTGITPAMVDEGRKLFHGKGTCFACHGMNLEGGPIAPTLKAHAWKDAKGGELSAIYFVITHGVNGTAMVSRPGGISDADAIHAATYIWSVSHRGAKP